MKNQKLIYGILAIVAVIFIVFTLKKNSNTAINSNKVEVSIACNLPLSSDLASYGEPVKRGVELALDELKAGKMLDSVDLKFDFQDNAGNSAKANNILRSQFQNKPNVYVSGLDVQTASIIKQFSTTNIPHFVWTFEPFICMENKNTFRTWTNFRGEAQFYIDFAKSRNPKRVAMVFVDEPGSRLQFDSIIKPGVSAFGVKDIFIEGFGFEKSDFKDLAQKIKNFKADVLLLNGYDIHLVQLLKELRAIDGIKDNNSMCSIDLLDAAPQLDPNVVEGLRCTAPIFNSRSQEVKYTDWRTKFKAKFNTEPKYTDAYAYDMTFAIYQAAKSMKMPIDNDLLQKKLLSTNFEGLTGKVSFDKYGDINLSMERSIYKNGKLLPDNQ
jgi:branched-chain amino acid transport system substrate-binding protein